MPEIIQVKDLPVIFGVNDNFCGFHTYDYSALIVPFPARISKDSRVPARFGA